MAQVLAQMSAFTDGVERDTGGVGSDVGFVKSKSYRYQKFEISGKKLLNLME